MDTVNPVIFVPIGGLLSAAIAAIAYRRGALSRSGVAGAMLTGTLHFGFGGPTWGLTLIAFFATSTVLSRYRAGAKEPVARQYAKGGRRDLMQTLANGGLTAVLAVVFNIRPSLWLFIGALATVTADTWATELGVLSRRTPRLVTTGRAVPPGTSGGVTAYGLGAALAGAALIGVVACALAGVFGGGIAAPWVPLVGAIAGLAGSVVDSVLGATVQAQYRDAAGGVTERAGTARVRGIGWMTNDAVNFAASIFGAALGAGVGLALAR